MVVVGCGNRCLQCDGVGEFGVLEEDGGLTGEGGGLYKMSLKGVGWKKKDGETKILKRGWRHVR